MCGKKSYDRTGAKLALAELRRRRRRGRKETYAYRCAECGAYHLTSQKSRKPTEDRSNGQHYVD